MDPRRRQEEVWKTNEDMARYAGRRFGDDGCRLEWRERYCQRPYQTETTRRPMFHLEREELSLSLSKLIIIPSICHQASLEYPGSVDWNVSWPELRDRAWQSGLLQVLRRRTLAPDVPCWTWWIRSAAAWIGHYCRILPPRCWPLLDRRQSCQYHEVPCRTRWTDRRRHRCRLPASTVSASRLMDMRFLATEFSLQFLLRNRALLAV